MINEIKKKLRKFVIRYHFNQMIRGAIFAVTGLLGAMLIIILAEHFGYFNAEIRRIIFFAYLVYAAIILYKFIVVSLFKIYGINKPISDMEASRYIGKYMEKVDDKLTNLLQLENIRHAKEADKQFLNQAIEQKASELKPFDFKNVIDFRINRKYLKYLSIPVLIFVALLISAPDIIVEPTKRLTKYNEEFERPQPFYIHLENSSLEVAKGDDLELEVNITGDQRPENLFFKSGNTRNRFVKKSSDNYVLTLKNIRNQKEFVVTDGIVKSRDYKIIVRNKPEIIGYTIEMDYPDYTGKKDETTKNTGDLIVPCGTNIQWKFNVSNTEQIKMILEDETVRIKDEFKTEKRALENFSYRLVSSNQYINSKDTLDFEVNVVRDQYPEIELNIIDDSSSAGRSFYSGSIADDYGFTKLNFAWKVNDEGKYKQIPVNIEKGINKQAFYFTFQRDTILQPGDELFYYFKVWDNDRIKGPKSTKTSIRKVKEPSEEEIEEKIDKKTKDFKEKTKKASEQIDKMKKDFEKLRKKMVEKENLDWDDKEAIKDFLERSENLKDQIEQLKKDLDQKTKEEEKLSKKQEDILEKEKKLKELMEKLLDEELLKKIEELKKLLDKEDKDKIRKQMDQMMQEHLDMEKELERNLELFKRLDVEKDIKDAIEDLKELEEKQDEAIESEEDKKEKQEEINKDFDKIKEKLEKSRDKNKELENPMNIENTEKDEKELENSLKKSLEKLKQGKKKKGEQSQQQSKQKMNNLSEKLQDMMMEMEMEQKGEDLRSIRQLMDNTLKLSLEQEELMNEFENTSNDDPQFVELIQEQKDLKEDLQKVKDSLYALSKRQIMIQSFVNKELNDIDRNMSKAMESMLALNTIGYTRKRDKDEAVSRQQYIMKGLNNIALMLSESMENMKKQMRKQGRKMGKKKCNNPKPGKSGKQSLEQMQKQLNQSLEQMKKELEKGMKKGKDGKSMSEKFARNAAKQREIRRRLEELRKQMQSKGNPESKSIGETLKEMEKTEEDLVNKILRENMLERQEEIMTRLLEHKEAKRKQEYEEKRKSEEAKDEKNSNPDEFLEYKRGKEKETELLRLVPPELAPFYRNKMNEYYLNLGK
ncbi:MAG: hypothetical protein K9I29_00020 [Bacteroidales bacterium]|nr:hypothetical protein [Bacteroidales bacterium]MCF8326651.1 hypothetical protein [Bacteroidales bacterium]